MNQYGRQQRGPNPRFNQQQPGAMPKPAMGQPGAMPQPGPGMMHPGAMGQRMPPQMMGQPTPMGIPPQQQMMMGQQQQNVPPAILEYQQNGYKLLPAVSPQNPNYKAQVGEFIYEYVERIAGEDKAPKITGMLIDLPLPEIQGYLTDFGKLQVKINEANTLLSGTA
jgi:hypothetical protein